MRFLYIDGSNFDEFDIKLPQALEEVELHDVSTILPQLGKLRNLKYLRLLMDTIKEAVIEFSSNSLEVLNLSHNQIEKLQLTFPEGDTNLKQLDLYEN